MNSVEILGIREYEKTIQLKGNVEQALKELSIEIPLLEVSEVDALMESDISAIPALKVNGQIVVQQNVPNIEDLKILLKVILQPSESSFEMGKILVPTDFSPTAKGAFNFALKLIQKSKAKIKLAHCFRPEVDPAYPYLSTNSSAFLEEKKKSLEEFSKHPLLPKEGGIDTSSLLTEPELVTGFATEEIIRMSNNPDIDMIIMGTTGEGNLLNKLFGTVSSSVAQKAHCPVLLIPKGVAFKGFRNVLYASNYQTADEAMLQQIIDFVGLFDANVHFVHVVEDAIQDYKVEESKFEQVFRKKVPSMDFNMLTIQNNSFFHAINKYIKQNKIDLMVMATSHRNFVESILHKSKTKKMVFNSEIPLMVMHFDD